MTALKAHEVARFLGHPDLRTGIYLVYGNDNGRIRETARKLLTFHEGSSPDPMSQISLDASDLDADPSRLAVEARTPSLFGGTRTIRVRNVTKSITTALSALLDDMPEAIIVLEAANLTKSDALRTLCEKHRLARALPCFADDDKSLEQLIRQHFTDEKIDISPDAIATLRAFLGNDREVTRQELLKLSLFAQESKKLNAEDVTILCGDNTALALDKIVDAAGSGRAAELDEALSRAISAGTNADTQRILSVTLQHFIMLRRMRIDVDAGKRPRDVVESARPRPHFSRTANLETQLRLWNDDALAAACQRIYEAIAQTRVSANLAASITQRALLAICVAAAHK